MPGTEGDFGVLAGHAPLIVAAAARHPDGLSGGEQTRLVVLGGFAEVGPSGLTVLADVAALGRGRRPRRVAGADRRAGRARARAWRRAPRSTTLITRLDHFKALDQHLQGTAMH